jgi:hypothetical protein
LAVTFHRPYITRDCDVITGQAAFLDQRAMRLAYPDVAVFPCRHVLDAISATEVFVPFFRG